MAGGTVLEEHFRRRGLRVPDALASTLEHAWPDPVAGLLYRPVGSQAPPGLEWAEAVIDSSDWPLLPNLVPLLPVDERSFACVVASDEVGEPLPGAGAVVRWHLDVRDGSKQAAVLDTDCLSYVTSVCEELSAREPGLRRMLDEIGPSYEEAYISNEKRPRDFVVRPVRIACQNVIVGLAAIAQDSSFDGLSVVAWQTCEVPHLATHEANRALAALMLADAFQNGGTMEIRFDHPARVMMDGQVKRYHGHPERRVPASLRRFGRTVGVALGSQDPAAITPAEARDLFLAITPMPDSLHARVTEATTRRGIAPERLCFSLLSQVWREVELDFLLATTARAESILEGGADWRCRSGRQAEMEACRAAVMTGMYFRRLNNRDNAGAADGVRVVEDASAGVTWEVLEDLAAVSFRNVDFSDGTPWATRPSYGAGSTIIVFPRSIVSESLVATVTSIRDRGEPVAVALPMDVAAPDGLGDIPVLRCPDRIADLDKAVEAKLLTSRISRG